MKLELRRIILFTDSVPAMRAFYGDVIGLKPLPGGSDDWLEFDAGTCRIALHKGKAPPPGRSPKLSFHAADVAAMRAALMKRGARMGKIVSTEHVDFCDGKDPDGNAFQISSR